MAFLGVDMPYLVVLDVDIHFFRQNPLQNLFIVTMRHTGVEERIPLINHLKRVSAIPLHQPRLLLKVVEDRQGVGTQTDLKNSKTPKNVFLRRFRCSLCSFR